MGRVERGRSTVRDVGVHDSLPDTVALPPFTLNHGFDIRASGAVRVMW